MPRDSPGSTMLWTIVGVGALVALLLGKRRRTLLWLYARQRLRGRKKARRDHVECGGASDEQEDEEEAP